MLFPTEGKQFEAAMTELFGFKDGIQLSRQEREDLQQFIHDTAFVYVQASISMPIPETDSKPKVLALLEACKQPGYAEQHGIIPGHDISHMIIANALRGHNAVPLFLNRPITTLLYIKIHKFYLRNFLLNCGELFVKDHCF